MSALDKVLRLAQPAPVAPDASELVRAACDNLDKIALLLAKKSAKDPDGDGDDDTTAAGDTDHDYAGKKAKKKPVKAKKKPPYDEDDDEDDDEVEACRALVLETMVALAGLQGGETVSLSVLTAAERRKPSAHTIPGSDDYPIPDAGHLSAAIARYKEGKYAGHPASVVKKHILSRARALGKQVELTDPTPGQQVIHLAAQPMMVPMEHGPFNGKHRHPHRTGAVIDAEHHHNNDSRHGGGYGEY